MGFEWIMHGQWLVGGVPGLFHRTLLSTNLAYLIYTRQLKSIQLVEFF